MKKITILVLHLGYGGLERCVTTLANALNNEYKINIVSAYKLYNKPPFDIKKNIKIEYLIKDDTALRVDLYKHLFYKLKFIKLFKNLHKDYFKKGNFLGLVRDTSVSIKTVIDKRRLMINYIKNCDSDIIISTRDIYNEQLGKYGKKTSLKIGWEHNHPHNNEKYANRVTNSVKHLDYFVLVSNEIKEYYQEKLKESSCKCIFIPNSLDEIPSNKSKLDQKNIISIGRLSKEKGYDELIEVFDLVHNKFSDWKLNIIGDGSMHEELNQKIKNYKLSESIELHGFQNKQYINELLKKSSIYLMTSHTESFGIVLLEAFSFGIPCIAFDSAEGANDIITNDFDGYLISNRNKKEMAKKVCDLIENITKRNIMGANGILKANKYNIEDIKKDWIELFENQK